MNHIAQLVALPTFTDNYICMLHDTQRAVVVAPGDAAVVLDALTRMSLQLDIILVTHHPIDHTGGVAGLHRYQQDGLRLREKNASTQ